MATVPTVADLLRAKQNLDAYDDVINGSVIDVITTPGGRMVDSLAKAIETIKAFNFKGDWAQNTSYDLKDVVIDPDDPGMTLYVRVEAGDSPATGTFQDEYDNGDGPWRIYNTFRQGNIVFAETFGIVADSTADTDGTDNSTAILALIGWLAANPGHTVIWPQDRTGGMVGYAVQLNFFSCKDQTHIFGAPLRHLGASHAHGIFFGSDPYVNTIAGTTGLEQLPRQLPFPIETAVAGQDYVDTLTPEAAAHLSIGQTVMVSGYDQQGYGYPPNYRYYEWRRIRDVDGQRIYLDFPLEDDYDADWYFYDTDTVTGDGYVSTVGPAGIIPLDRGVYAQYADRIIVVNLRIARNPNDTPERTDDGTDAYNNGVFFFGARKFYILNYDADRLYCGNAEHIVIEDSKAIYFEPDKTMGRLDVLGGQYNYLTQGYGIKQLYMRGTYVKYSLGLGPRKMLLENVHFGYKAGQGFSGASFYYGLDWELRGCTYDMESDDHLISGWDTNNSISSEANQPGARAITVASVPTTSTFTVDFDDDGAPDGIFRQFCGKGISMRRGTDDARYVVKNITFDSDNNRFVVEWNSTGSQMPQPEVGDILYFNSLAELRILGATRRLAHPRRLVLRDKFTADRYICPQDGYHGREFDIIIQDLRSIIASGNNYIPIDGYVSEIEFVVRRAQSSGEDRIQMSVNRPTGNDFPTQTLKTGTVGRRIALPGSAVQNNGGSAVSGETIAAIGYNRYVYSFNIRPLAGDSYDADAFIRVKGVHA